jgi:hypothetical protein
MQSLEVDKLYSVENEEPSKRRIVSLISVLLAFLIAIVLTFLLIKSHVRRRGITYGTTQKVVHGSI